MVDTSFFRVLKGEWGEGWMPGDIIQLDADAAAARLEKGDIEPVYKDQVKVSGKKKDPEAPPAPAAPNAELSAEELDAQRVAAKAEAQSAASPEVTTAEVTPTEVPVQGEVKVDSEVSPTEKKEEPKAVEPKAKAKKSK